MQLSMLVKEAVFWNCQRVIERQLTLWVVKLYHIFTFAQGPEIAFIVPAIYIIYKIFCITQTNVFLD